MSATFDLTQSHLVFDVVNVDILYLLALPIKPFKNKLERSEMTFQKYYGTITHGILVTPAHENGSSTNPTL